MNTCPQCSNEYDRLGQHFALGSCERPALTERQCGIVEYLILRGANVRDDGQNSRLEVFSTERERLALVADALGWLANEPRCHLPAGATADSTGSEGEPDSRDMWAFTTVAHPSLGYDGPTGVTELRPFTLRLIVSECGTFVGDIFGSLHIDLRGFDVSGDHFRTLLARENVTTAEYDGEGYATDTHTARYHYHDDVLVVPHFDAVDLLDSVGISMSDVADPIELGSVA